MSRARCVPRGMTLVELLVTMAVLAILTGLVVVMLVRAKTSWQASTTRAAVRQELQEISWRISREVQASSLTFLTDGGASGLQAFSFVSAVGPEGRFLTDDQGSPAWNQQLVYYLVPGTTRLLRKEIPRNFTANPEQLRALTPAELAAACDGQGRLVSSAVNRLRLTPQTDSQTAVLEVQAQGTSAHGGQERLGRRQTILLYNE
ncbi:MAG: type II secretion system protein [Burkholderiales bacterium]|nr:type II secretion system protein [Burkholderiales bacterium]